MGSRTVKKQDTPTLQVVLDELKIIKANQATIAELITRVCSKKESWFARAVKRMRGKK